MKTGKSRSLRHQLLIWLSALLIPLLLISTAASYFIADHFASLAYDRSLFRKALSLADQVEVERGKVVADLPQIARELLEYDKDDLIFYLIRGPNGEQVTGRADLPLPAILPKANNHVYYDSELEGNKLRVVAFSLPLAGTSAHGVAVVLVAETRAKRYEVVNEIIASMMLPQLLIAILAGLMVYFGVQRGLAGLERLRDAFSSRSIQDLSPVAEVDAPQEVQALLRAMNDLMQRLRDAVTKQQRFITNASHQLRTPLAGLKTQAELALREQDPAQVRHALQQIQTSSTNLARLVAQLLALARAEPEAADNLELVPLDLSRIAREVTGEWVPKALAKNIDLGFVGTSGGCLITGNSLLLRELINNLIDNAIRYTPANGLITVTVNQTGQVVELSVEDNGIGIPEEKRERVLERFYRILGTGEAGSGLGLTIVSEIAARHGANVTLQEAGASGGTLIKVTFPQTLMTDEPPLR
jgi:two-component system sensor histidine kinase TctE